MYPLETADLIDAASAWLQRINAPLGAVAVVNISPDAAVGLHVPGQRSIGMLPTMDDAAAELAEAVAPVASAAMNELAPDDFHAVAEALGDGGKVQMLIDPTRQEFSLRLIANGRRMTLAAGRIDD